MKWILASTTALALTMGAAQVAAQDTAPSATETPPATEGTDTEMNNQPAMEEDAGADSMPATPDAGTEATEAAPETAPDTSVTMDTDAQPMGSELSANDLVGADVIGPDGNSVGAVDDLVMDASGKIERVIIADGAVFGFGGKNVAIDYAGAQVSREADGSDPVVRVSMTDEALDGAAEFDKSQLEQQGDRLASSYLDRDVKLAASEGSEGEINDLLLDQSGTVKYAIIAFGGIAGIGEDEVAVGFDKISGAPEGEPMQVSMTEEELQSAPKYEPASTAPAMDQPAMDEPAMNQPVTPAPEPVAPAN